MNLHDRKVHQGSFVLLYEELWWWCCGFAKQDYEYSQTLSSKDSGVITTIITWTADMFVFHLQGIHTECLDESSCRKPGYECSKTKLTSPLAIEACNKALMKCSIYRHADFYCRVRYVCNLFLHVYCTFLFLNLYTYSVVIRIGSNPSTTWSWHISRSAFILAQIIL